MALDVEGTGETFLLSFGSSIIGVRGRTIFLFSTSTAKICFYFSTMFLRQDKLYYL